MRLGATHSINPKKVSSPNGVKEEVYAIAAEANRARTKPGEVLEPGADVAIECVGIPRTFEMCEEVIAPGGRIANVGVHGSKVDLHLQDLWIKNIGITTGLVNAYSTEDLLNRILTGTLDPTPFVTHEFKLDDITHAYEVFGNAAHNCAIKTFIQA